MIHCAIQLILQIKLLDFNFSTECSGITRISSGISGIVQEFPESPEFPEFSGIAGISSGISGIISGIDQKNSGDLCPRVKKWHSFPHLKKKRRRFQLKFYSNVQFLKKKKTISIVAVKTHPALGQLSFILPLGLRRLGSNHSSWPLAGKLIFPATMVMTILVEKQARG